ncbi:MAG: hypothetical protein JW795_01635 [Chitinivibrionales bacterium]|nr:hypothetical protein [Chitinivibrionales bacterium]
MTTNTEMTFFATIESSCVEINEASQVWKQHLTCPRRVYKVTDTEWDSSVKKLQNGCIKINDALRGLATLHPDWIEKIYPEYTTIINLNNLFHDHFSSIAKDTLLSVFTKTIPSLQTSVYYYIKENHVFAATA